MRVLLADAILLVHFLFVLFVIGGLVLTWIGAWRGWRWIRSLKFRIAHLAAIVFVAGEALLGIVCPLTEWEDALRGTAGGKSFIARWVHRLMFFSAPEWVFSVLYVGFALVVAATFWLVPPARGKTSK
jgi:Protein of Unknown function (DUF2784)